MDFNTLSLADLRVLAKEKGLKSISALKKSELIQKLEELEKNQEQANMYGIMEMYMKANLVMI